MDSSWENRGEKVFVTGAGGFIGSHLVERLVLMGASVRALVHYNSRNEWGLLELLQKDVLSRVEVVTGDVQDPVSVRKAMAGCSLVYHLASLIAIPYSYHAPQSYVATNVMGTLNVMQAGLENNVEKIVHTSTSEVYGTAQYVPIDEKHPLHSQSPYSASKIGADMIAESYYHSFGLPVTIIRPFNTYGPRQSARAIIPTIVTRVLNNGPVQLGNLHPTRDLNYVSDIVEGFIKVAESRKSVGEVINIGTGQEISIRDLSNKIFSLMNYRGVIQEEGTRKRPEKSEVERLLADNTKAKRLLGWQPRVGLDEGLQKTIQWFSQNLHHYKSKIYNI